MVLETECGSDFEKGYYSEKTIIYKNDSSKAWEIIEYDLECKLINRKTYLDYREKQYVLSLEFFEDSKRIGPYVRYNKASILQKEALSIDSLCIFYMDSMAYCRTMQNDTILSEWGVPLFIEETDENEIYLTAFRFDNEEMKIRLCKESLDSGAMCKSYGIQGKSFRVKLELDSIDLVVIEIHRPHIQDDSIYTMGIGKDNLLEFLTR